MKILRPLFPLPSSAILLAALAVGAAVAAEKSQAADAKTAAAKFELSWTRLPAPELKLALENLKVLEQRFRVGLASTAEVLAVRQGVEELDRRASYNLTVRSNGGTLRDFVAAATGSDEVSFNLINAGTPSDLDTPIPAFTLRNSNWGTVATVLGNFLATRGLKLTIAGSDHHNPSESKSIVCVLRRDQSWANPADAAQRSDFEAFNLADYLSDKQTVDAIVDAIQTAAKLDSSRTTADLRVKFHPATKMLFVAGPEPATKIARQVIASLQKNPVAR